MGFNFNIGYNNNRPEYVERNIVGDWFYSFFNGSVKKKVKLSEKAKLDLVLQSPTSLKVLCFLADTYSQVKIDKYFNEKLIEKDFIYSYQPKPNSWQTWTDLFWEHRFWLALGNAYLYVEKNVWYYLKPHNIEFTSEQIKAFGQISFSEQYKKELLKGEFKYNNENGVVQKLKLSNLHIFTDLSGGISGDWLKGNSRIDALVQIISNSESAIQSKGTNLKYTEKFLVSGQGGKIGDVFDRPMDETEKDSIEKSLEHGRKVNATISKVDMQQMVSNLAQLELDDAYESDLIKIANMYDIPKDVIDILSKGSTYENQEKSLGRFINYTQMPKVQQFTDTIELILNEQDLRGHFKHLPFNSVFEVDKINNRKTELESLKIAQELGADSKIITDKLKQIYEY